jgi:hypothetical protein
MSTPGLLRRCPETGLSHWLTTAQACMVCGLCPGTVPPCLNDPAEFPALVRTWQLFTRCVCLFIAPNSLNENSKPARSTGVAAAPN